MASELRKLVWEADDIPEEVVDVPEWNIKVLVRGMNGRGRANFLRRSTNEDGQVSFENFYPELIIATAFDPESEEQIFESADRDQLNTKSGVALNRLAEVAQRLSGLGSADLEEAKKESAETVSSAST